MKHRRQGVTKIGEVGRRGGRTAAAAVALLLLSGCANDPILSFLHPTAQDQAKSPEPLPAGRVAMLVRLGNDTRKAGDPRSAIAFYRRAHELDRFKPEPLIGLGKALSDVGAYNDAANAFREALTDAPRNAEAMRGLGMALIALNQPALAIGQLEAAQKIAPDWRTLNALGVAHDRLGQYAEAQKEYDAGLKLAPGSLVLLNNQGLSLALSGNLNQAVTVLGSAAKDPMAGPRLRQNLALVYGLAGRDKDAARIASIDLSQAEVARNLAYYGILRASDKATIRAAVLGISTATAQAAVQAPGADRLAKAQNAPARPAARQSVSQKAVQVTPLPAPSSPDALSTAENSGDEIHPPGMPDVVDIEPPGVMTAVTTGHADKTARREIASEKDGSAETTELAPAARPEPRLDLRPEPKPVPPPIQIAAPLPKPDVPPQAAPTRIVQPGPRAEAQPREKLQTQAHPQARAERMTAHPSTPVISEALVPGAAPGTAEPVARPALAPKTIIPAERQAQATPSAPSASLPADVRPQAHPQESAFDTWLSKVFTRHGPPPTVPVWYETSNAPAAPRDAESDAATEAAAASTPAPADPSPHPNPVHAVVAPASQPPATQQPTSGPMTTDLVPASGPAPKATTNDNASLPVGGGNAVTAPAASPPAISPNENWGNGIARDYRQKRISLGPEARRAPWP